VNDETWEVWTSDDGAVNLDVGTTTCRIGPGDARRIGRALIRLAATPGTQPRINVAGRYFVFDRVNAARVGQALIRGADAT